MTDDAKTPVHVPTMDELNAEVVEAPTSPNPVDSLKHTKSPIPAETEKSHEIRLSSKADTFLRLVANAPDSDEPLETFWKAMGVKSGSSKQRVLDELTRHGLIRLKKKGRTKTAELYPATWTYLGVSPPTGEGRGGTSHREIVKHLAKQFARCGFTVHVEKELGAERKRIDLLALGKKKIGIEIGLSSVDQELTNLSKAIESGVLDEVVLIGRDGAFVKKVRQRCRDDAFLKVHMERLHFYRMPEDDT